MQPYKAKNVSVKEINLWSFLLVRSGSKIKGYLLFISVFDLFCRL
jgi:hypothetical protein